jgi:hypothetical protein
VRPLILVDDITSIRIGPCVQRKHIGELLGQIRDLEFEWTDEAIQRVTTENITLKQCGRQLSTDNRILDERLKAARSNVRFGLVSGQLSKKRPPEGAAIPFLISCCPPAASIRFLGMLFPPRDSHSLHPTHNGRDL